MGAFPMYCWRTPGKIWARFIQNTDSVRFEVKPMTLNNQRDRNDIGDACIHYPYESLQRVR